MDETESSSPDQNQTRWRPVRSHLRRVLGVLIEKAKTTPDAYPMTINGLVTGANQKTNRAPLMNMTPEEVQQAVDELREMGAVVELHGSGRVPKYRHQMYEWMGVEKAELAVMAELLLRGEQTVGELRSRVARMEPIAGLPELKPILQSLIDKDLVRSLTPEGRGQVVCHNLYKPRELEQVEAHATAAQSAPQPMAGSADDVELPSSADESIPVLLSGGMTTGWAHVSQDRFDQLQAEVTRLQAEVASLRDAMAKLEALLQ